MAAGTIYGFNNVTFQSGNGLYGLLGANPVFGVSRAATAGSDRQRLGASAQSFVTEAKLQSENMKLAMVSLMGKNKSGASVFDRKTAVSGDTNALGIKSYAAPKNDFTGMTVKIDRVATTQKNAGLSLAADNKICSAGLNTIEIESGGKKTLVSFKISLKDDNTTVQRKMADAINGRNAGVVASVVYDKDTKKSALSVESLTTGANDNGSDKFTIRDLQGDSAERSGVSIKTRDAVNALYSVNGGETAESKTNAVDLGNGVTAVLKNKTDEVRIAIGPDKFAALNAVRDMVNAYNGLLAAAEENPNDGRTANLLKELKNTAKTYASQLKRAGIETTGDGYMKINEKKMDEAADSGELKKLFTGEGSGANYGFAYRMSRLAERVNGDPSNFVTKSAGRPETDRYDSDGRFSGIGFNYTQLAKMERLTNFGALFEFLV